MPPSSSEDDVAGEGEDLGVEPPQDSGSRVSNKAMSSRCSSTNCGQELGDSEEVCFVCKEPIESDTNIYKCKNL